MRSLGSNLPMDGHYLGEVSHFSDLLQHFSLGIGGCQVSIQRILGPLFMLFCQQNSSFINRVQGCITAYSSGISRVSATLRMSPTPYPKLLRDRQSYTQQCSGVMQGENTCKALSHLSGIVILFDI